MLLEGSAPKFIPKSFPRIAALLYLGVLCTGVYYSAAGLCSGSPNIGRLALFAGLIVLLLAVEQVAQRLYRAELYVTIGFLLAHMILFELVSAADCSGISRALYPIVPFAAYFSLGRRAGYGL